jgi:membrane fusion protein (multidrug efflux system)
MLYERTCDYRRRNMSAAGPFASLAVRLLRHGPLLALALIATACSKPKPASPQMREVGYVTLETQPVTLTTELSGRTNPHAVAEVRPQVSGIILKRLFKEGGAVKVGDALYQIDPATYQAARDQAAASLASAKASLAAAKSKAARYDKLLAAQAVSSQDAEDADAAARQADAAVLQAAASLKSAEINLAYTRIVAPITGQIGRSSVTAGALVTANQSTALATIYQLDPIYVDITESSTKLARLRKALASGSVQPAGADVSIVLDDGSLYNQTGHIEFSETEVDEATGAVTIRATVPNPDRQLLPGQFVRVRVNQGVLPDGILAPQQGITRDSTGAAIALIVGADNKVEGRKLVADRAIGDQWLVTSGLQPGDKLIVEGTDRVKPGQTVKIAPVALAKAK